VLDKPKPRLRPIDLRCGDLWVLCANRPKMFPDVAEESTAPHNQHPASFLHLIVTGLFGTSREDSDREPFMCPDADLTAVVYDPPAPGFPHMAVLFDADGEVVAVRPVESIAAGEAVVASLIGEAASEEQVTA
jgi:hypothetical protein